MTATGIGDSNLDPWKILEVSSEANDEEIRAAYLRKVLEYPPDRAPEMFEQVRESYEMLRDPWVRMSRSILSIDPFAPFVSLLPKEKNAERHFTGPQPWLEVLKEK